MRKLISHRYIQFNGFAHGRYFVLKRLRGYNYPPDKYDIPLVIKHGSGKTSINGSAHGTNIYTLYGILMYCPLPRMITGGSIHQIGYRKIHVENMYIFRQCINYK